MEIIRKFYFSLYRNLQFIAMRDSQIIRKLSPPPFVKIVIPMIFGMIIFFFCPIPPIYRILLLFTTFFALAFVHFYCPLRSIWTKFYLLFWIFAGGVLVYQPDVEENFTFQVPQIFLVSFNQTPYKQKSFYKCDVTLESTVYQKDTIPVNKKILLYIRTDSAHQISTDFQFNITTAILPFTKPLHWGEFDYRQFMHRKGYVGNAFIEWSDIEMTNQKSAFSLLRNIRQWQSNLLQRFESVGIHGNNLAILQALTLGDKTLLSEEIKQRFSKAGAMHVLAVSGMHVGILFMILSFLLTPFQRSTIGRTTSALLIMSIIWCYALLTGLSASTVRAAIMFSIMSLGKLIRYPHNNSLNAIAASAFLILIASPSQLFDIGFQLSFAAVIAIVLFQSRFETLITTTVSFFRSVFNLLFVSVSATLGTLPFTLLIFQQFPTYFILTNFLVTIPVFLIMLLAICIMIFGGIPIVGMLFGTITDILLSVLNGMLQVVENLPFALIENIYISPFQSIMLGIFILLLAALCWFARRKIIILMMFPILFFCMGMSVHKIARQHDRSITFFSLKNTTAILFTQATQGTFVLSENTDASDTDYSIKRYLNRQGFNKLSSYQPSDTIRGFYYYPLSDTLIIQPKNNLIHFGKQTVAILDQKPYPETSLPIDIVLCTKNARIIPEEIMTYYNPQQVIIDVSLSKFYTDLWENYSKENTTLITFLKNGQYILPVK